MNYSQIRQTMTDDAYDIISAFSLATSLSLHAIAYITGQEEHMTRFILEQMAAFDLAVENHGLWCLTEGFKASAHES
ncbi:hypothetical protein [Candidatus Erwinia dacicola]|uniref:Uncharacterized protein n=1 Tax=Candidatus Erwinia dacicola TaxID=252393 RepID=A0A1E7YZM5_9GAMM|nr:hypothetical protein [Candidatus Erwinia dacicola]OFC61986.1 hypothetical protein BBW68_11205 [Candidatus Erwinia dacicola]RAP70029.1 hypothetical protein ACZ87_03174 [Candidatus Erwinia dacicola]